MRAVSPISCISGISRVLLVACVSVASLLFSGPALAVDPLREAAARAQARVDATTTDLEQARREVKELESKRQQAMEELAEQLEPEPIEWSEDALGDAQSDQRKRLCAAPDQTQACIDELEQAQEPYRKAHQDFQSAGKEKATEVPKSVQELPAKLSAPPADATGVGEPVFSFCNPPNGAANLLEGWVAKCRTKVEKFPALVAAAVVASQQLAEARKELKATKETLEKRVKERDDAVRAVAEAATTRTGIRFRDRLRGARLARCITAYCWGGDDGTEFAIEPIIDLPVSMFWALGDGALARHINANRLDVSVAAGVRFWFSYDQASIGILLANPTLTGNNSIRIDHSDETFPAEAISRPFPTLAIGIAGDLVTFTISYDQLRNTDGTNPVDDNYLPNQVLSRTFVLGISLYPFTAARTALSKSAEPAASGGGS